MFGCAQTHDKEAEADQKAARFMVVREELDRLLHGGVEEGDTSSRLLSDEVDKYRSWSGFNR